MTSKYRKRVSFQKYYKKKVCRQKRCFMVPTVLFTVVYSQFYYDEYRMLTDVFQKMNYNKYSIELIQDVIFIPKKHR